MTHFINKHFSIVGDASLGFIFETPEDMNQYFARVFRVNCPPTYAIVEDNKVWRNGEVIGTWQARDPEQVRKDFREYQKRYRETHKKKTKAEQNFYKKYNIYPTKKMLKELEAWEREK